MKSFSEKDLSKTIANFKDLLKIDLDLAERTVKQHVSNIEEFLKFIEKHPSEITKANIRQWLKKYEKGYSKSTKANKIKSLRVFFREFVGSDIAEGFKIPRSRKQNNVKVPSKEILRKHFEEIPNQKYRAYFLVKASSGLRNSELTNIMMDNVDLEKRMLTPGHETRTKQSYISFYNREAEKELEKYLAEQEEKGNDNRLWKTNRQTVGRSFRRTSKRSGAKVTPKLLRKWFVSEMKKLGVNSGFIDAFCGRVPRSIQDSHYTDLSPKRLREVYGKANLTVLT